MKKPASKTVLFSDIKELMTLEKAAVRKARGAMAEEDLSLQRKTNIIVEDGKIVWIGARSKIPKQYNRAREIKIGANLFPGFIDCHTHSVFAGERRHEFELRNQGVTYQQIAQKGGGILFTVQNTREASEASLQKSLNERLSYFLKQGVTTVEIKSGYGLTIKDEIKILKAIKKNKSDVKTVSTFLGAHALPPEYKDRNEYLEDLKKSLADIYRQKLASRVDIFVEENYFSVEQANNYLQYAKSLGYDLAVHADQLTRTGATALAVQCGAVSADHVICVHEQDIKILASSDVTSVLLPTSDFFLHCAYPPARKLIDSGARVALSCDFNPGTSPTQNIQFVGLLARSEMKMTLPEVFVAYTLGGAYALKLNTKRGALLPGFEADFFVSEQNWNEFFYDLKPININNVWINGDKKV